MWQNQSGVKHMTNVITNVAIVAIMVATMFAANAAYLVQ